MNGWLSPDRRNFAARRSIEQRFEMDHFARLSVNKMSRGEELTTYGE